ncbi:MAG: DNA replication and repair protein RecF [Candidatus Marinimicrobia bacterium]|nr:DNA replication and repair protein RecF [Candidatus Neomarinimicrobiota bacterium]MBL7023322.1 DNA replication and repair protein RecF [Candidatus Neomarinimicrobiota bacterium]
MRIFDKLDCDFTKNVNLIFGENGKGKTTILEAIHMLSLSKSFRPGAKQNVIKQGKNSFSLASEITTSNNQKTKITYNIFKGQKRIKINDKQIERISDLVGVFPVVIMSPEDADIISGHPQARRNYINKLFSVIDKNYLYILQQYTKALRQKRETLFYNDEKQLEAWNHQMAIYGTKIWEKRNQYTLLLQKKFNSVWEELEPKTHAEIQFISSSTKSEEEFIGMLKKMSKKEKEVKRALFGPHTDKLKFIYKNKSLKDFGSHGEKKILLSALKLAEAKLIKEKTTITPVVLMDDLFAKLDKRRSIAILKMASKHNQVFITTTDSQAGKLIASESNKVTYFHLDKDLRCYEA